MHIRRLIPAAAALLVLVLTGCGIAEASTAAPALQAPAGPTGQVIEQHAGWIVVAPFSDDPAVIISVTGQLQKDCKPLTVYRAGVCRTEVTTEQ